MGTLDTFLGEYRAAGFLGEYRAAGQEPGVSGNGGIS
jgi:hypothetical protein